MASAFQLRSGEDHLSVNWLEHGGVRNLETAVGHVRSGFRARGYRLRPNGRFAVLNVGAAKAAVIRGLSHPIRIEHLPRDDDPSHAGIFGYTEEDLAVAVELKAVIGPASVH